ncbi:hypothetical protein FRC10_008080 [Ceratobasidium sp. 414]|nr:hypothetical protein FRC10_008080 [Ceratobasidium sp. 414]
MSQRSIYGSVMSSSWPRNRLHKAHRSLDETHDNNDITKRPQRKLVKKSRQQQRSDSPPEERGSVTPPEQKPHSNSLPTTLALAQQRRSIDQPYHGWSENEPGAPSRGRARLASMRHSVGSSADVLLTPIRGSTAISDDFVLVPASRTVETSGPYDLVASPDSERPESPEPTIATLVTESETHHEVEHPRVANTDGPDQGTALGATNNSSGSDLGGPVGSRSHSSLVETQTIHRPVPQLNVDDIPLGPSEETTPVTPRAKNHPAPMISVIEHPAHKGGSLPRPAVTPRTSSKGSPVKAVELHNVVPFPSDPDPKPGPWHATLIRSEAVHEAHFDSPETALAAWILTVWKTAIGIVLFALECCRWLVRKGFRDDFRSGMSYWFLRELTVRFALPLLLAATALWWFYRMVYPHYDLSPMAV